MRSGIPLDPAWPVTRELAAALAEKTFADFEEPAITDARRAILDWLGSAMAGSFEPSARMVQRVVAGLGRSDEATVFATGRSSAAGAALANGAASHILELDDVHKASTLHPAAPVISAALAVAEREHADGQTFMMAVILGYEAALRIGEAVNPSHYAFWHPTGTAGTFGAAIAAGTLNKLDTYGLLNALGTAGTQAAGLWEFNADGTMSKPLHPGKAAFNGVLAADLAREGFTGASRILEGDRGFFRAMSTSYDATRVTEALEEYWRISETCYKIWACCAHTHSAIDVATAFRAQRAWTDNEAVDAITSIEIETYGPGYEIVKEMNPRTPSAARFSLGYCVAAALLYGGVSVDAFPPGHFTHQGVTDADIAALLGKTRVTVAEDLTAMYPAAWPTRLRITLTDGTVLQGARAYPVGNPESPVSTEKLKQKFTDLVTPRWGSAAAARAIRTIDSLESCSDMAGAFNDLTPSPLAIVR